MLTPVSRSQAAVLKWEGDSSTWDKEDMDPETLYKRFRCAVLQLVNDDCYQARVGSITLVLDLYRLSRDMQVRSTCVISPVRLASSPGCSGCECIRLQTAQGHMLPVQRDFRDVTACLRLFSLGTLAKDCIEEHMETAILVLGTSRSLFTTCPQPYVFDKLSVRRVFTAAHATPRLVDWQVRRRWSASNSSSMRCSCWSATPCSARVSAPSCRNCWSAWLAAWHTQPCHSTWLTMLRRSATLGSTVATR